MKHMKSVILFVTAAGLGFVSIGLTLNLFVAFDALPTLPSPQEQEVFAYTLTQRAVMIWAIALVPSLLSFMIDKSWKHALLWAPLYAPPLYLCVATLL